MPQLSKDNEILGGRYALCVGIGTYTNLSNHGLRYAVADATIIAERLADPQRGNFTVTLLTEPNSTCKAALDKAMEELLSAPDRQAEDLIVVYFSCHGTVSALDNTFCLLPSDAALQAEGTLEQATLIGISDFARWLFGASAQNIVILLDVCHSGGAGAALQLFKMNLNTGLNYFIIGGARQDQFARGSSLLQHGFFTHCLLRAFEQPPTKDGWLTISQVHNFVSDEIPWYYKGQPIQIQGLSVSVNPNLPLLRNPCYPELSPLPPLWNVPLQRNPFFTGQDDILSQLASMLQSEQKTALTQPYAINGLGGIGKTQLALEYAYRHRQDYHAVLWGRADSRETLISTFVNIAYLLDLPQKDEKDQMVTVEAVKAWLMERSKWLLILDNADELAFVKEFIPPAFPGHLLLTTRAQAMGGLAHKLEVEVMPPEIGALLLLRRASLIAPDASLEQASPANVTIAKELSEEMGGLPLALDQAGAYIEEVSCSLQYYRRLYQVRRAELLKERGGVGPDHPESVETTWSLAFQKVEQGNPAASDLLRLCAFLHPDAIPEEVITKGSEHLGPQLQAMANDPLALDQAIKALQAYSLLRRDPTSHALSIHRLVQAVLKESMNEQTQRKWAERTVRTINLAFPHAAEVALWEQCERYLPHALVCAALIEEYSLEWTEAPALLKQTADYLEIRAQYPQAEPLYQRALAIREKQLGPEHPDTADSLSDLAALYVAQGKYEQAEPLHQQALTMRQKALGPEHPQTASSLDNLAGLYVAQGKYEQAEPLHQQALTMRQKALGPQHPYVAISLMSLAALYRVQGKYEQVEPLHQQALAIMQKALGPEQLAVASNLDNLATLYSEQGKYEQVEPLHQQALAAMQLAVAISLDNLATLYSEQGKYEQAEPLYLRALRIWEQQVGPEHPTVASNLNSLAKLYVAQGKYEQAEPLHQRALAICEQQLGPQHPDTADNLNSLAKLYVAQGKYEQAEPLYQQALTICEQQLGPQHPDTADNLNSLAALYFAQGKYEQAEPLHQRALAICEQQLGLQHPQTANSLDNLAALYSVQGKYEQAEPLHQRALAICEQQLGLQHPQTANSLNNLALLYAEQGKYKQAEPLLQRALAIRERQLGPQHPDTANSLGSLALLYAEQGKYKQAEPLLQRALAIYEQNLGPEHPRTQEVRADYANLLREMERNTKRSGWKGLLDLFSR